MLEITDRQNQVLRFIADFFVYYRYAPTFREIATHFAISVRAAHDHVRVLQKKGYVHTSQSRSRALRVIKSSTSGGQEEGMTRIPIVGNVAAGTPLFSYENFDGYVRVASSQIAESEGVHFALRVEGDSMREAGILDGDIAVLRHQNTADNGDIVVAQINEQRTLKRFFRERSRIRLQPENSKYTPIYSRSVLVLGKLRLVMRDY